MDFTGDFTGSGSDKDKGREQQQQQHDLLSGLMGSSSVSHGGDSHFEEDLMREFNQKATELSTFLDESTPIHPAVAAAGGLGVDLLSATSVSEKSSTDTSPNPPNLSTQAQFMEAMGGSGGSSSGGDFDLIGDFNQKADFSSSAGGDSTKIKEDLMSASREYGQDSPMDLGFEQVAHGGGEKNVQQHSVFGDQMVPPSEQWTGMGHPEVDFHNTQSEPVMKFGGADEERESPKLPDEPCFKPKPEYSSSHGLLDPTFNIEKSSYSAPEVSPKLPSPKLEHFYEGVETGEKGGFPVAAEIYDDYSRRDTMAYQEEFEAKDSFRMTDAAPPPIPKHSYETSSSSPPPVPKHADEVSFQEQRGGPPFIHATYDDKIDDEFEDDSLSRPLSHKLSDSLEVLKESPQKEMQLDESLMDLDELPSSSSSNAFDKNISGGGDFGGGEIPREMLESTLFSQQPPTSVTGGMMDEEEKYEFTHDVDQAKPVASIPPFANQQQRGTDSILLYHDFIMIFYSYLHVNDAFMIIFS